VKIRGLSSQEGGRLRLALKRRYKKCYKKFILRRKVKLIKVGINNLNNLKKANKLMIKLF
jgi:hypothetical protein